jgi:hypothetical protein
MKKQAMKTKWSVKLNMIGMNAYRFQISRAFGKHFESFK